jgi:TolA-binding protein
MLRATIALCLALMAGGGIEPALAQASDPARAQTLADLRAEIAALSADLSELRREFLASGSAAQTGGGTLLDRIVTLESEIMRLTGATEALDLRLRRIVDDATLRIGDLEYRLTELEGGDTSALGTTQPLGGDTPAESAPAAADAAPAEGAVAPDPTDAGDAIGTAAEQAGARLDAGDPAGALAILDAAIAAAPDDPAMGELDLLRGEALLSLGRPIDAAQAFLDSVSGSPDAPWSATALLRLGATLGSLGETVDACLALTEVVTRHPADVAAVAEADRLRATFSCP